MTSETTYATLNSFRPISPVSNLAKILEKIILNRLQWYARNGNWISSNLHGFTEGRSTETACHSLVSFTENGFNCKQVTAFAFLDIKSAFDMAWHPTILAALIKRGCVRATLSALYTTFSLTEQEYSRIMVLTCLSMLTWAVRKWGALSVLVELAH